MSAVRRVGNEKGGENYRQRERARERGGKGKGSRSWREEIALLLVTYFRIFSSFRSQPRQRASSRCVLGKYILSDSNAHF